ncbi:hypothetical protein [Xylophilus sp. GOD-11R]|uniref:hypothetical protein n=1 Tax=Xylophilus sp. GOD-11R TaxID=3089814 RepID=UPI00298D2CD8|nr:hypothetical protein [Xylophilus sp. GOD-11R]WPB57933.1 hypothetical protein R9X41_04615 [Xylophilus sp. GOD-11R]
MSNFLPPISLVPVSPTYRQNAPGTGSGQALPTAPGVAAPATPDQQISPEVHALLALPTRPRAAQRGNRAADGGRKERGEDSSPEEEGLLNGALGGARFHYGGGSGQSSEQNGEQQGDRSAGMRPLPRLEDGFLDATTKSASPPFANMTAYAAGLAERCGVHHATHGQESMNAFLRTVMVGLLPSFMRDLVEQIAETVKTDRAGKGFDALGPIRLACQEFLDLMRPLYARYANGPYLVSDARDVLCAAQDLLAQEADRFEHSTPRVATLLTDSVRPLLPVLVMAGMPRPLQIEAFEQPVGSAA